MPPGSNIGTKVNNLPHGTNASLYGLARSGERAAIVAGVLILTIPLLLGGLVGPA
jgi:hypothetical protein